ncbi:hypothetical protein [Faecalimicrobium dakarense]|uniref:hypothetical protein n=1 Tax=Faecalimicrobium dakarense TaxID=1301100 RepID=UPI0004AD67A8|nr:hypothetical protein [[Clostridium] dakarense]
MKKKYLLYIVSTIVIVTSLVLIREKTLKNNLETVTKAYEKLIDSRGDVEYVKVTKNDGSYEEYYKDSETAIEQRDEYNKNNELKVREIFHKNEGKMSSIYNENGKFEGSTTILSPQIAKENKELENISLMESMSNQYTTKYLKDKFKKVKNEDSSVTEYKSKTAKIYINKDTDTITKVESIHPSGKSEVIEYKKLKKGEKDLFRIDAKNNSNIDLSNVKLKEYMQEDINYENVKG